MTQSDERSGNTLSVPVSPPTSSLSLEQYYRERLENVRQQLPSARHRLQDAGVARVLIEYDGCGDSGQIESITFLGGDGRRVDLSTEVELSSGALMELFYDLLETRHPGWENNDGATGEFVWDLIADTLIHTHHDRFTDYDTTEHEGL